MTVKLFPDQHRKVVATIAQLMAEKAEQTLIEHLGTQWDWNERRGIDDEENERDVQAFADAVQAVWATDQFVIAQRAVASVTGRARRATPARQQPGPSEPLLHVEIVPATAQVIPFLPLRPRRYVCKL